MDEKRKGIDKAILKHAATVMGSSRTPKKIAAAIENAKKGSEARRKKK